LPRAPRPPRAPRSFPTRRSSDLLLQAIADRKSAREGGVDHVPPLVGPSEEMEAVRRFVMRVGPTDETVAIYGETGSGKEVVARQDRKSTRLNSSHVKISYAVFCV